MGKIGVSALDNAMTLTQFLYLTKTDLHRYAGRTSLRDFAYHYLFSPGYRYTFWLRLCAYLHSRKVGRVVFPFAWLIYDHFQIKYGIAISYRAKIGRGFYISHHGGIVTNVDAVIGENCNLSHGVTIGVTRRGERMGVPVIGDNVYIGPGAKIIGAVRVGDRAAVGANCVVTRDVPDDGVVVGVPGKVISLEGSKGYINHTDYDRRRKTGDRGTGTSDRGQGTGGQIARLPTDGLPQILFYMSGTVVWHYFSGCLSGTSHTFTANAGIFGKVYFPRLVTPISLVISNLISFAIQLTFFLCFLAYFVIQGADVTITTWALTLPLLILIMASMGLGFGIIISSLTTKYRDLSYLVGFGVSLWMYATPVIYPVSSIPARWRWLADVNPMTPIIETFRAGFLGAGDASWLRLGYSALFMLVILFLGIVVFNRVEKTFIDTV